MTLYHRWAAAACVVAASAGQAAAPEWRVVNAAQVYLREAPASDARVLARLPAGLEVEWLARAEGGSAADAAFCVVRYVAPSGATKTGHVACRFLTPLVGRVAVTPAPVSAPAFAAQPDDPSARWVGASNVNLRAAPALDAAVLARLPVGARVVLDPQAPDSGSFCAVAWTDRQGVRIVGHTACRYLATTRVDALARPGRRFDAATTFWLDPGVPTLLNYGGHLEATRLDAATLAAEQAAKGRIVPAQPVPRLRPRRLRCRVNRCRQSRPRRFAAMPTSPARSRRPSRSVACGACPTV